MSKSRFAISIAVAAFLVATPAMGQLVNFPVVALAPGDADGVNAVSGGWARGLNDQSGKANAIGAAFVRGTEMVSFGISGGYVMSGLDEVTLAGSVAYHLPIADAPVGVSIQTGIGWINTATSVLNFPVGVALQGSTEAGSMMVTPWVMPRVHFTRVGSVGAFPSSTATDFGASAGAGFATEGGFGFGVALDLMIQDDIAVPADNASSIGFLVYASYMLP
jgi:hypothetical protein